MCRSIYLRPGRETAIVVPVKCQEEHFIDCTYKMQARRFCKTKPKKAIFYSGLVFQKGRQGRTRAVTRGVHPWVPRGIRGGQTQVFLGTTPIAVDDGTLGLLLLLSTYAFVVS
jgi:hypothetical protein